MEARAGPAAGSSSDTIYPPSDLAREQESLQWQIKSDCGCQDEEELRCPMNQDDVMRFKSYSNAAVPKVTISGVSDDQFEDPYTALFETNDPYMAASVGGVEPRTSRPWRSHSLTPLVGTGSVSDVDKCLRQRMHPEYPTKTRSLSLTLGREGFQPNQQPSYQTSSRQHYQPQHGLVDHGYSATNFLSAEDEKIEEMIRDLPEGSGMKGIRDWLKSLRLHKYTKILLEVKYEELLELTDEDLEKKGVTLGARGKILKNVGFMKDRPNLLNEICINLEEVSKTNDMEKLKHILVDLEAIILMPLKPHQPKPPPQARHDSGSDSGNEEGEDIPSLIFNALKKVVMIIFLSEFVNHEVVTVFACLLNRCLKREAFDIVQKQKISSWLQKMRTLWNPPSIVKANDYRRRSSTKSEHSGKRPTSGVCRSGSICVGTMGCNKLHPMKSNFVKRHSYQEENKLGPLLNLEENQSIRGAGNWHPVTSLNAHSRRESNLSTDSGYMTSLPESRRPSDVELGPSYGGGGSKTFSEWQQQRRRHDSAVTPMSDYSASDYMLSLHRRDSGMSSVADDYSLHSELPSRRSSAFSTCSVPGIISEEAPQQQPKQPGLLAPAAAAAAAAHMFPGSVSSEGSTDSLLEQDLHNLSLSVTQQALE